MPKPDKGRKRRKTEDQPADHFPCCMPCGSRIGGSSSSIFGGWPRTSGGSIRLGPQVRRRLIDGEARAVGGDLEQDPTRLPEVHRPEILAVDHRGDLDSLASISARCGQLGRLTVAARKATWWTVPTPSAPRQKPEARRRWTMVPIPGPAPESEAGRLPPRRASKPRVPTRNPAVPASPSSHSVVPCSPRMACSGDTGPSVHPRDPRNVGARNQLQQQAIRIGEATAPARRSGGQGRCT